MDNLISIGFDIGQKSEPSGLCVAELENRGHKNRSRYHFRIRHLERIASGSSYPEIAARSEAVSKGILERAQRYPNAYVDVTGLGQPIIDLLNDATPSIGWIMPVYFTHGDKAHHDGDSISLGKSHLLTNFQALLQSGRIHLPRTEHAETLASELLEYEIQADERANERANEREGAFRVGTRDDLVTALGLAVHGTPPSPGIYLAGSY